MVRVRVKIRVRLCPGLRLWLWLGLGLWCRWGNRLTADRKWFVCFADKDAARVPL